MKHLKEWNLNDLGIEDHRHPREWYNFGDNSIAAGVCDVYFRNLEEHLIELIKEAETVVGCVAWLTNESIINALAELSDGAAIVVQKEDFLRPDLGNNGNWSRCLRNLYDKLTSPADRYHLGNLVSHLSVSGDSTAPPVRCVGNYNRDKNPAFPRMHNKFLVFCKWTPVTFRTFVRNHNEWWDNEPRNWDNQPQSPILVPYKVWTGSFNLTKNATLSLENAIVINDETIVNAYFDEWQQIYAASEPLDWETDWVEPQWRLGT